MNEEWLQSKDNHGICGAEKDVEHAPDMVAIRNDYRWTPACQRTFLEELACTGSVLSATKHVAKSPRSAYGLRYRRDGAAFRLAWDAAILIARATLADMLMDRAIHGYEEMTVKQDDGSTLRGKYDNRLGQGLLSRLDRMAEAQAAAHSVAAQVQLVVQDFESFLDLVERGGKGAEAAIFFAARDDAPMAELAAPELDRAIQSELGRISAAEAAEQIEPELLDMEPEDAAARLSVWYDGEEEQWKTNFPPCNADDAALIEESGLFGDADYERSLTPDEEEAQRMVVEAETAPLRNAALKAHAAWFGMKDAA
jgi:hypothetical protein